MTRWTIGQICAMDDPDKRQLADSIQDVMDTNRSPEPHRTVAWEPEPTPGHTDGYPASVNMDDIVAQIGVELSWIEKHGTGALNDLDHAALLVALRDEIERLRQAGDALAQGIRTGHWDDALDTWTELRGG